jgi:hypothetical protein
MAHDVSTPLIWIENQNVRLLILAHQPTLSDDGVSAVMCDITFQLGRQRFQSIEGQILQVA